MPPKLNLLHVVPYYEGAAAFGGIPRVAGRLCRGLAAAGHRVEVWTTDAYGTTERAPWPASFERDGVRVRVFRNLFPKAAFHEQLFLPPKMVWAAQRNRTPFDLIHLHAHRNLPEVLGTWLAKRMGVPYVLTPNGTAPNIERRHTSKRLFDAVVGKRILHHARMVFAVSHAERNRLQASGVPADRITVVPNPIDLEEFESRPREGYRKHPKQIVYLGKTTVRKRVDTLLRAVAKLPATVTLVIAGSHLSDREALIELVRTLGIPDRVRFVDVLDGEDRLRLLAEASVVAYAGEQEVFGLVAMEAILMGTPVVVANDSGCGEVIDQVGGGRLVTPGDVDALTDALQYLLETHRSEENTRDIQTAGQKLRARFGIQQVSLELANVYAQILA